MYIDKKQADALYSAWCVSEDTILLLKGESCVGIEYDEDGDVAIETAESGELIKVIDCAAEDIQLSVFKYLPVISDNWKQ